MKIQPHTLKAKLLRGEVSLYEDSRGRAIRYREGRFQLRCDTCAIEKWDYITEAYADKIIPELLKD